MKDARNQVSGNNIDRSREVFTGRFEEAEDFMRKDDLFNAYIHYLIAYDYALTNEDKFVVKMRLGDILMKWGDFFSASQIFREALRIKPDSFDALKKFVIANAENLSPDFPEIIKSIPQDKIDSEILYYWGKYVLKAQKDPRKACDLFDSVRKDSPYFFDASYLCGVAMVMIGDREEALRRFRYAEMSEDKNLKEHASLAIARILTDVGRFEEALPYYLKIPKDSPAFYEAKYETCWVLYALGRHDETRECVNYFKTLPKSHLSKRIGALEAFLNMRDDLVSSFLSFTSLSDYSSMLISQISEISSMPDTFWKRGEYLKYLGAKEANIKDLIEYFPDYKQFVKKKEYIENLQKDIAKILSDLEKIRNTSFIVADKAVRKYFERLGVIQKQIQDIISKITYNATTSEEKNTWFNLYTISDEIRTLDIKARELAAIASVKANEISEKAEFKNWEKKYKAYSSIINDLFKQIEMLGSYYETSAKYVIKMADILAKDGKNSFSISDQDRFYLQSLIDTYSETKNVFFEFSSIWKDIISSVDRYLGLQEKKLRQINNVLNNFLEYLNDYQAKIAKYIVTVKLKNELMKTFSLAQYGFIESAWTLKEMESSTLDKLYAIRLEEENKLKDEISKIYADLDKIEITQKDVSAKSSLELELNRAYELSNEINEKISEAMKNVNKAIDTKWSAPDRTIQELFQERRERLKQLERMKN